MMKQLFGLIEAHPVFRHTVFSKLASRKLPASILTEYLYEMGMFCAASRKSGLMAEALEENGYGMQAGLVREIFKSEEGHGATYVEMARLLIKGSVYESFNWGCLESSVSEAIGAVVVVFEKRKYNILTDALYSLGALLRLERAGHRQSMPGEGEGFIRGGE